ncbi:MAG: acyltransferase [Lachnospiraceae bacterium]|nr:acyltransferase [Lachnospiraceae bacterium]
MPEYTEYEQPVYAEKEYFEGLNALRLLAMFFVVILHVLLQGGILKNAEGASRVVAWLLETGAFCAVNIYALTTGFLSYSEEEKPFRYSRVIRLWFQVLFYSVLLTLLLFPFHREELSLGTIGRSFFPVINDMYWYFSAFVGVMLIAPLINYILRSLTSATVMVCAGCAVVFFSIIGAVASHFADPFGLYYGYSFVWLAVLYFIGAVIRKVRLYEVFPPSRALLGILVCWILLFFFQFLMERFSETVPLRPHDGFYFSYLSPAVFLMAVFYLLLFASYVPKSTLWNFARFFAPAGFGVYLIHAHPLVLRFILNDLFVHIAEYPFPVVLLFVLAIALMIFVICLLIDTARGILFERLYIDRLSENIEGAVRARIRKMVS